MRSPVSQHSRPAVLYSAITVMTLSWSFNFIFGKIALRHFDVTTLAAFRIIVAALILLPIYYSSRQRARLDRKDLWTFAVLGFFGVLINQGLFTIGLNFTTAGHSSLIIATAPILVLLIAWAKGLEAFTASKAAGMALSFAGVAFLAVEKGLHLHSGSLRGDVITLAGVVGFAVYAVWGKKVALKYDSLAMNTFNSLAAAILLLPFAIHQGIRLDWRGVGWAGWGSMFYMAAFSSVLGYLIFYWALRHMAASRISAFSYVQPVIVTLLGIFLLGEHLTRHLVIGGALVLFGVYIAERGPDEDEKGAESAA